MSTIKTINIDKIYTISYNYNMKKLITLHKIKRTEKIKDDNITLYDHNHERYISFTEGSVCGANYTVSLEIETYKNISGEENILMINNTISSYFTLYGEDSRESGLKKYIQQNLDIEFEDINFLAIDKYYECELIQTGYYRSDKITILSRENKINI